MAPDLETTLAGAAGAVHVRHSRIILDEDGKRIRCELDADGNRAFRVTHLDGIC